MKKNEVIDGKLTCPNCHINKCVIDYYRYNGRPKTPCKCCKLQYQKAFSIENKEEIKEYKDEYYLKNREELIANQLLRDKDRTDEIRAYQVSYRRINKIDLNSKKIVYKREKYQSDISFKLRGSISNAIYQALVVNNSCKNGISCLKYLPYTMQDLKDHLESQFETWMNWNNRGLYLIDKWNDNNLSTWTWQIDHIIPQSKLPYTSMTDDNFKKCWALENLRPMNAKLNVFKGIK